jgi:hypothetical protein
VYWTLKPNAGICPEYTGAQLQTWIIKWQWRNVTIYHRYKKATVLSRRECNNNRQMREILKRAIHRLTTFPCLYSSFWIKPVTPLLILFWLGRLVKWLTLTEAKASPRQCIYPDCKRNRKSDSRAWQKKNREGEIWTLPDVRFFHHQHQPPSREKNRLAGLSPLPAYPIFPWFSWNDSRSSGLARHTRRRAQTRSAFSPHSHWDAEADLQLALQVF